MNSTKLSTAMGKYKSELDSLNRTWKHVLKEHSLFKPVVELDNCELQYTIPVQIRLSEQRPHNKTRRPNSVLERNKIFFFCFEKAIYSSIRFYFCSVLPNVVLLQTKLWCKYMSKIKTSFWALTQETFLFDTHCTLTDNKQTCILSDI